jgi:hypothetical protein
MHAFLLFDDSVMPHHDEYVAELASTLPNNGHTIWFQGTEMSSQDAFYSVVRSAIPAVSSNLGSNLDAVHEVLRDEALSLDPKKVTYWIWPNCDRLYLADPQFFWRVFNVFFISALEMSETHILPAHWNSPTTLVRGIRRVCILLTGRWETFRDRANCLDSNLFHLPSKYSPMFPDLWTRLEIIRVVGVP